MEKKNVGNINISALQVRMQWRKWESKAAPNEEEEEEEKVDVRQREASIEKRQQKTA